MAVLREMYVPRSRPPAPGALHSRAFRFEAAARRAALFELADAAGARAEDRGRRLGGNCSTKECLDLG
eukprot:1571781-Prymnesium_polylepis.1